MTYKASDGLRSSRNHFIDPPSLTARLFGFVSEQYHNISAMVPRTHTGRNSSRSGVPSLKVVLRRIISIPSLLVCIWAFTIWSGERSAFRSSLEACQWHMWEQWPAGSTPHHLILLADPQLVDPHTYPGRPWPLSTLTVLHTDLYLRRSFRYIQEYLRPDTVFFLGDLFDGGREWGAQANPAEHQTYKRQGTRFWMKEYSRFSKIFFSNWKDGDKGSTSEPRGRRIIASIAGNHDIGIATGIQESVKDRFDAYFGPLNRVDVVGNHTVISLDTVSLSAMDKFDIKTGSSGLGDRTGPSTAISELWLPVDEFLDEVKSKKTRAIQRELQEFAGFSEQAYTQRSLKGFSPNVSSLFSGQSGLPRHVDTFSENPNLAFPTILLTHVPLYRDGNTDCGPLREGGHSIRIQKGFQYQNVLTPLISQEIITRIGPEEVVQVYSGDDHDYCEIEHHEFTGRIKEITVKSMSWAMGVRKPGFLAVSLHNPVDVDALAKQDGDAIELPKDTIQNHLCLLPDQLSIFIRYALVFGFTFVVLAIRAVALKSFLKPGSSSASKHTADSLLPISEKKDDGASNTHNTRLKRQVSTISSSSSSSAIPSPDHFLSATNGNRSGSPAVTTAAAASVTATARLGTYGNLPAISRSSSPGKNAYAADSFAPAAHASVIPLANRGTDTDDDDGDDEDDNKWGRRRRRKSHPPRTLAREFLHSLWHVAWPSLLFYIWVVWHG